MKTQSIVRSALVVIVALGSAIGATVPVHADDNVTQVHVRIHGLNLADDADRQRVERQIKAGARQVCSSGEEEVLIQSQADRRCYRDAVRRAYVDLTRVEARGGTAFAALAPSARTAFPR
jgi:UrcA family protein